MTKNSTLKSKRSQIRRQLRSLLPGVSEPAIRWLSQIEDPVERVGAVVDLVQRGGFAGDVEAVEQYRIQCLVSQPAGSAPAALADLNDRIGRAAIESARERLEQRRLRLLIGLYGSREAAGRELYAAQPEQPDDRRYRPGYVDPLLRGSARATGQTATAVRSGRTVTDWQHTEREARR